MRPSAASSGRFASNRLKNHCLAKFKKELKLFFIHTIAEQ
jgi:hypothetical protein